MALQGQWSEIIHLKCFCKGKGNTGLRNHISLLMLLFFCLPLPSFAVEIVLLSPEGMAENCKAFKFWLQMGKFPLERLLRFPGESSLGPHPHQAPKYCPRADTFSVTLQERGRRALWMGSLGEKETFQFLATLRVRKLRLKSFLFLRKEPQPLLQPSCCS